jgi:hypothetical protein
MGRASRCTQSSSIDAGRHGGGTGTAEEVVAVEIVEVA